MWLPTEYVGATSCGALLLIPLGGRAKMTGGYLEKKWIGIKKNNLEGFLNKSQFNINTIKSS